MRRILNLAFFLTLCLTVTYGQESRDSLVRLLSADKARLVEMNGKAYRKVVGNAVFFHNNTYLKCDSAYWNVDDEYIDAIGSVRIEQENTVLTGDSLRYVIAENTAKFRGHLVELVDRDSNTLRTNYLDYNTKDSVAFFYRGGAMKDEDGNVIESLTGRYQSKIEQFDFIGQVEMFSDSLFFVCDTLYYYANRDLAEFFGHTAGWYDLNHISSGSGWYDRTTEKFFFTRDVYGLTEDYELWCDSLNYDRYAGYAHLLGEVQLLDTVDNAITLAGELRYWNEPRRAELYRDPAVVMINEEDGVRDSIFMASDTLIYYTMRMCDVDSAVVASAKERHEAALVDPLAPKTSGDSTASGAGKTSGGPSTGSPVSGASSVPGASSSSGAMTSSPASGGSSTSSLTEDKVSEGTATSSESSDTLGIETDSLEVSGVDDLSDSLSVADTSGSPVPTSAPDSLSVSDSLSAPDSLTAADSLAVPDSLAVADSLAVSDSLSVSDSLTVSDSLAVSDSLTVADSLAVSDSLAVPDSLSVSDSLAVSDSLSVADSLAVVPPDTTQVDFVEAYHNVRIYKSDVQVLCDSLLFNSIDSIARLFDAPVLWYEIESQITADSMQFLMRNGTLDKGLLFANCFVISEEEPGQYYHQIKSPEMIGYFKDGQIARFDALGGVTAMFYVAEDSVVTTMNQKECRIMTGRMKDGQVQRILYTENITSDVYPVRDLTPEMMTLRNFNWMPDMRPATRFSVTDRPIRPSGRKYTVPSPDFPRFKYAEKYFTGYMDQVMAEITARKPLIWIE